MGGIVGVHKSESEVERTSATSDGTCNNQVSSHGKMCFEVESQQTKFKKKCKCNLFTHGAPCSSQELVKECPCIPRSNWNLEILVFDERGKPEYPKKNLSEQSREPTTNSTYIRRRVWESNPGHIDGRRALSATF